MSSQCSADVRDTEESPGWGLAQEASQHGPDTAAPLPACREPSLYSQATKMALDTHTCTHMYTHTHTHTHTHTRCTLHALRGIRGPSPGKKFFTKVLRNLLIGRTGQIRENNSHINKNPQAILLSR
jgi:hypothetical protein